MALQFAISLIGAAMLLTLTALPAAADCEKPGKAPRMPQGATATEEDMRTGRTEIQAYVNLLQAYQACLNKLIDSAPPDTKPEVKQQWIADGDAAIELATRIADVFTSQLRAFKSQNQ